MLILHLYTKKMMRPIKQIIALSVCCPVCQRSFERILPKQIGSYKVEYNILPCPIAEFISKRDIHYKMREVSDFERKRHNKVLCGSETSRILDPKIWDLIPNDIKLASSLFKSLIKKWAIQSCLCRLCIDYIPNLGFL